MSVNWEMKNMSLKRLSGRKPENSVHEYFIFDKDGDKGRGTSACKACNEPLKGKNSTNLKNHLERHHKDLYDQFMTEESERKKVKFEKMQKDDKEYEKGKKEETTLFSVIAKMNNKVQWGTKSNEYEKRLHALLEMLITTGYPITMIDNPEFRVMISTFNPKFRMPGEITVQ